MNPIDSQIKRIQGQKRLGLMTHVVVGYPSLGETVELVKLMEKLGVDFVELQIPFSDPLADGPTIMKACDIALKNGVKVKNCFEVAQKLSKKIKIPLLFMAYFNTVFKYGVEKFCIDAKNAGVSGLIVPDMPIEEESCEHFMQFAKIAGLYDIKVVSPASTNERLIKNAAVASGFVYLTARQGTTGVKSTLDSHLVSYLKKVKDVFKIPVAVGFGISKKEHVQAIRLYADIAIVGSAVIDIINTGKDYQSKVEDFLKELI